MDYHERDQTKIGPAQARETGILAGLTSMVMIGGWDAWLIADGGSDRIEFWEGNMFFHSSRPARLTEAEVLMREFDCPRELS
jgi:hypothetical protein